MNAWNKEMNKFDQDYSGPVIEKYKMACKHWREIKTMNLEGVQRAECQRLKNSLDNIFRAYKKDRN